MNLTRVAALAAVVLISAASLTACSLPSSEPTPTPTAAAATADPTPEPSTEPTPTSEPAPDPSTIADFIVISGSGVGVVAMDSSSLVQIPYSTDGATAAALLAAAIGVDPVVADVAATGGGCSGNYRTYEWGGLQFRSPGAITTPGGQSFNATVTATATPGGLELTTVSSQRIGALASDFAAAVGSVVNEDGSGTSYIYFDRQNPDAPDYDAWGALGLATGGVVAKIIAPLYFYGDC